MLMNKASSIFKANVTRYLALCLIRNYAVEEECEFEDDRVMSLLEDSYNKFESVNCNWGMGIAKYIMGKFFMLFIE